MKGTLNLRIKHLALVAIKKVGRPMSRKYHNHTLQTEPWHCEVHVEPQNIYSNKTSVRQLKESNQLFGVSIKRRLKQVICSKVILYMILSEKRKIKALIRLRGCAGWSAHLLFANPKRQIFSRQGPLNLIQTITCKVFIGCIGKFGGVVAMSKWFCGSVVVE